jgi:dihydroorotase
MIDPHVHLRDWNQSHKETLSHGLTVAMRAGIEGLFEMPNTDPPLITSRAVRRRIEAVDSLRAGIFHGLFLGLTAAHSQIEDMVKLHGELFPRTVGMKLYAGGARGDLAVTGRDEQMAVFEVLARADYRGVLAVHCEDKELLRNDKWDCRDPRSHCRARPPESEISSVRHIIHCARSSGFAGRLHICHISVPEAARLVSDAKKSASFLITCAVTPHHALLNEESMISEKGLLLKVNPPLRSPAMQKEMLTLLLDGHIDFIESDHAPHRIAEKLDCAHPDRIPSGLPVLPFLPRFLHLLKSGGMSETRINELTVKKIEETFGFVVEKRACRADMSLAYEYDFDPFEGIVI